MDVVKKYQQELMDRFNKIAKDRGYTVDKPVTIEDVLEEVLCACNTDEFMKELVEGIEDSVGMESYGFKDSE